MTDPTPTDSPAADPPPGADPSDPADPDAGTGKAGAEAAKYRVKLREAETERDALAGRVQALQTAQVGRIAGARLAQADDLFAFGLTLEDLLTDGDVDEAVVEKALAELIEARPGLAKVSPPRTVELGQGGRGLRVGGKTWADVIRPG